MRATDWDQWNRVMRAAKAAAPPVMQPQPRRIVQFQCMPGLDTEEDIYLSGVYALGSDGTLWWMRHDEDAEWERQPDLPQGGGDG